MNDGQDFLSPLTPLHNQRTFVCESVLVVCVRNLPLHHRQITANHTFLLAVCRRSDFSLNFEFFWSCLRPVYSHLPVYEQDALIPANPERRICVKGIVRPDSCRAPPLPGTLPLQYLVCGLRIFSCWLGVRELSTRGVELF